MDDSDDGVIGVSYATYYDGLITGTVEETWLLHSDHVTLATASWVTFDSCDGSKLAYWCTSPVTDEIGNIHDKFHCKLVCLAGDATGKHYFYGDSVTHDVSAWTV